MELEAPSDILSLGKWNLTSLDKSEGPYYKSSTLNCELTKLIQHTVGGLK